MPIRKPKNLTNCFSKSQGFSRFLISRQHQISNKSRQFNLQHKHQSNMLQNPLLAIFPEDQANLILILMIAVPLSYILSLIYNKYLFLAMSMSLTIGVQSILFPQDRWYLWAQQQIVYLLVIFAPRKYVGHIIIVQSFIALTLIQAKRMYLNYGQNFFDVTAIFCMQLFNYIGMGYNYQNGAKPSQSLTKQQLQRRIVQKPSYITYLGYVNFLPACLVGPVYEYTDFEDYLHRRGDYVNIPSTFAPTVKEGVIFLLAVTYYGVTSFFPISEITGPAFLQYSLPYRFFYCLLCITHIELKYVAAWSLSMISMRASGITYNPRNNKRDDEGKVVSYDFGRVEVNNMTKFYLDPNMKIKVDNWNISVQWALRRYIYENLYNPKNYNDQKKRRNAQAKAQIGTVLISALWHGIYPGYFVSFIHWILYIQIFQEVYRLRRLEGTFFNKMSQKYPKAYDIFENLSSTFAMTYFGVPFHLMTWSNCWIFGKATLFLPFILLYVGFVLIIQLKVFGSGKPMKEKTDSSSAQQKVKEEVKEVKDSKRD